MQFDDEGGLVIPLSKKQGIIALLLVGIVIITQAVAVRRDGPAKAREPLLKYLEAEYARHALPGIQASMDSNDTDAVNREVDTMLTSMKNIEIVSLKIRGVGHEVYGRAEIRVNGKEPPDGRSVRYFEFVRSSTVPWQCMRDAMAYEYYIAFF